MSPRFACLLAVLGTSLVRLGYHLQDRARSLGVAVEPRGISAARAGELLAEVTLLQREAISLRRFARKDDDSKRALKSELAAKERAIVSLRRLVRKGANSERALHTLLAAKQQEILMLQRDIVMLRRLLHEGDDSKRRRFEAGEMHEKEARAYLGLVR